MTNCQKCGAELPPREKGKNGRPRKECIVCSPPKTPGKPPSTPLQEIGITTELIPNREAPAPGMEIWTPKIESKTDSQDQGDHE